LGLTAKLTMRFAASFQTYLRDLWASVTLGADARSRLRLMVDFTLSRFIGIVPSAQQNRRRTARFRGGVTIRYRLNKGDLHSIREVWFEEDYRLPFKHSSGILLDLGANIGMASIWLCKKYSFTQVIAVEPDPANAELVRDNFRLNAISGEILQAAIGPYDGTARFQSSELSNLGRLSEDGLPVQMISVNTVIRKFSVTRFALIKIDIEAGEQPLFDGPLEWLARTDTIIMELHPSLVDCTRLTKQVSSQGFKYIPAHSLVPDNLPCFTRIEPS
jgi:FkbM family methyltransferase